MRLGNAAEGRNRSRFAKGRARYGIIALETPAHFFIAQHRGQRYRVAIGFYRMFQGGEVFFGAANFQKRIGKSLLNLSTVAGRGFYRIEFLRRLKGFHGLDQGFSLTRLRRQKDHLRGQFSVQACNLSRNDTQFAS